jgi:predicted nucleotidyltransferase
MTKQLIFEKAKEMLKARGAKKVAIFGSYASGKQTNKSDLDLLVIFKETKSLLELATLERNLSESLGIKVDLLTENALSPHMADKVHEEMMVIYE